MKPSGPGGRWRLASGAPEGGGLRGPNRLGKLVMPRLLGGVRVAVAVLMGLRGR